MCRAISASDMPSPNWCARWSSPASADHLAKNLPVEAKRGRLIRRQRMAQFPVDLLQTIVIGLAELLDRDFGAADLGQRRAAEAAENVVDAPDRETAGEQRHHHAHDGAAHPIFGGLADTSKHMSNALKWWRFRCG